jgi:hypothetical protein
MTWNNYAQIFVCNPLLHRLFGRDVITASRCAAAVSQKSDFLLKHGIDPFGPWLSPCLVHGATKPSVQAPFALQGASKGRATTASSLRCSPTSSGGFETLKVVQLNDPAYEGFRQAGIQERFAPAVKNHSIAGSRQTGGKRAWPQTSQPPRYWETIASERMFVFRSAVCTLTLIGVPVRVRQPWEEENRAQFASPQKPGGWTERQLRTSFAKDNRNPPIGRLCAIPLVRFWHIHRPINAININIKSELCRLLPWKATWIRISPINNVSAKRFVIYTR